jgi:hypothetical protein
VRRVNVASTRDVGAYVGHAAARDQCPDDDHDPAHDEPADDEPADDDCPATARVGTR